LLPQIALLHIVLHVAKRVVVLARLQEFEFGAAA
jgi:hypothetical protein